MKDLIEILGNLQQTSVPNLLVLAGLILIFLAFVGKFGAYIELPPERQKWAGGLGALLLIIGIVLIIMPGSQETSISSVTPTPELIETPNLIDSLIAYYPLDGNADDKSGNGYHGQVGENIVYVQGVMGLAAQFDSSSDSYIDIGDQLDMGTDEFTVSAWIKADDYNQSAKIINKGQTSVGEPPNIGYSLRFLNQDDEKELRFDIIDDRSAKSNEQAGNRDTIARIPIEKLPSSRFLLITGVLRKSGARDNLELYVNGELVFSKPADIGNLDTNIPLAIGALHRGQYGRTSEVFTGLIDDVRLYRRALSRSEIQALYEMGGQQGN